MKSIALFLIITGFLLIITGILILLLSYVGLGRLPGDLEFTLASGKVKVFIPIVSMILLSLLLTVVINIIFYFYR